MLHHEDLLRIGREAGLGDEENRDPSAWVESRGVCVPAIVQFADGVIEMATRDEGHDADERLTAIFVSGFTLGIAVAEARR